MASCPRSPSYPVAKQGFEPQECGLRAHDFITVLSCQQLQSLVSMVMEHPGHAEQALCELRRAQREQTRLGGDGRHKGPSAGEDRESQSAQGTEIGVTLEVGGDLHTRLDSSSGEVRFLLPRAAGSP